jgi:peptidoglycan hydrolase CwlO-like protein
MQSIAAGGDAATKALIEQQKAQRELGMALSQTTTKLLGESKGLISSITTLTKGATFVVDQVNQNIGATSGANTRAPGQTSNGNTSAPSTSTAATVGPSAMDSEDGSGFETPTNTSAAATQSSSAPGAGLPVDMTATNSILTDMLKQQKEATKQLQNIAVQ